MEFYSQAGRNPPKSWDDFCDPNFPGRRGYGAPDSCLCGHLEIPLIAAGFPPGEITFPLAPEQEETIFQKLEELANHPESALFWTAGSEPPDSLVAGEVQM